MRKYRSSGQAERYPTDLQTHHGTVADGDMPEQSADNACAALASAKAALAGAREQMAALIAQRPGQNAPAVQEAAAALYQATLNLPTPISRHPLMVNSGWSMFTPRQWSIPGRPLRH